MTILPQQTALLQTCLLADEIVARFKRTSAGHCARVDFLERGEATEICRYIKSQHDHAPDIHILTSDAELARRDPLFITTDRAIEMRNRKEGRLCLFIPSDRHRSGG